MGSHKKGIFVMVEKHLKNLHYLWKQAQWSFTPKIHGLLCHAVQQMRRFRGIGDTLEDDVERIHQISAKIEARVSRMKNKANVHSKMEAIQNCNLVKEKIEASQQLSKRVYKKRKIELCANERKIRLKKERDESRSETLQYLENQPHEQLITMHDKAKAELLRN